VRSFDAPESDHSQTLQETDTESTLCNQLKEYLATRRRHCEVDADLSRIWEEFYRSREQLVRKSVGRPRETRADVDDFYQDAWLELLSHLPDLEFDPSRGRLNSWMVVVTRHVVARRATRHSGPPIGPIGPDVEAGLISRDGDPSKAYEARDRQESVRRALDRLRALVPAECYRVIHEHWIDECPLTEIASRLGLTEGQVRGLHRKAMRMLRALLASRSDEPNECSP
jgi:RNA polymerase sigma factor (sigma-70 family)